MELPGAIQKSKNLNNFYSKKISKPIKFFFELPKHFINNI